MKVNGQETREKSLSENRRRETREVAAKFDFGACDKPCANSNNINSIHLAAILD